MKKSLSNLFTILGIVASIFLGNVSVLAEPGISVNPLSPNFQNVTPGCTESQTLTITSTGTDPLEITSVEFDYNDFGAYEFLPYPFEPVSLAPDNFIELVLQFTPVWDTFTVAELLISSNAGDVYVNIIGDGYGTTACSCNPGFIDCGGICIDPSVDLNNCGACGFVCSNHPVNSIGYCEGGECGFSCLPGYELSNGECVPTALLPLIIEPVDLLLDFGSVESGYPPGMTRSVVITNPTENPFVSIANISFDYTTPDVFSIERMYIVGGDGDGYWSPDGVITDLGSSPFMPIELSPETSLVIDIVFKPQSAQSYEGSLMVMANAPGPGSLYTVYLVGESGGDWTYEGVTTLLANSSDTEGNWFVEIFGISTEKGEPVTGWAVEESTNIEFFYASITDDDSIAIGGQLEDPGLPGDMLLAVDPSGVLMRYEMGIDPYTSTAITVPIDIKPGSDPNSINCKNMDEVIAVALLTTEDFDATTVDHTTVTFAGAFETHIKLASGEYRRHEEDIDEDGDIDLVFHFRLGATDLNCNSIEGSLTGLTFDGQPIEGHGNIRIIDNDKI